MRLRLLIWAMEMEIDPTFALPLALALTYPLTYHLVHLSFIFGLYLSSP